MEKVDLNFEFIAANGQRNGLIGIERSPGTPFALEILRNDSSGSRSRENKAKREKGEIRLVTRDEEMRMVFGIWIMLNYHLVDGIGIGIRRDEKD